jgi:signal transduction histidine kinase
MNSLRARIALALVLAIVSVVAMSTAATLFVSRSLEERNVRTELVDKIRVIVPLVAAGGSELGSHLPSGPPPGEKDQRVSDIVSELLLKAGMNFDVVVSKAAGADYPTASVNFGPGWFSIPLKKHDPPQGAWIAVLGWVGLITVGTICVALVIAHRLTRQLAFLQSMAISIGSDGFLPRLPESGPAEVRATARALNTMGASLKSAVESRMRLVASAGHDLRTPLTRMRLRTEFLDDADRTSWLNDIDELEKIADSAIQLVREETNGKQAERVRIDELVVAICDELKAMNFDVVVEDLDAGTIASSPLAITRALRNLIINAATHGTRAHVSVRVNGAKVMVLIEDEGPGIPEEILPRVFEPFFRVDSARRKLLPGAGLGLAIAKEIVERHDGSLKIRNREPKSGLAQEVIFDAVWPL